MEVVGMALRLESLRDAMRENWGKVERCEIWFERGQCRPS